MQPKRWRQTRSQTWKSQAQHTKRRLSLSRQQAGRLWDSWGIQPAVNINKAYSIKAQSRENLKGGWERKKKCVEKKSGIGKKSNFHWEWPCRDAHGHPHPHTLTHRYQNVICFSYLQDHQRHTGSKINHVHTNILTDIYLHAPNTYCFCVGGGCSGAPSPEGQVNVI